MFTQTLIAFDYGLRNIGVASGNSTTGTASELQPLRARDGVPDWTQVEALLREWQPQLVVVGLPLNMDDSESELSRRARKFAGRIHGRFGVKTEMVDERLSSYEAKQSAGPRNYRDDPVDSIAARLILETWLQSNQV